MTEPMQPSRPTRRAFLGLAGGAAAAGGAVWLGLDRAADDSVARPEATTSTSTLASTAGHILVVLQLDGGNDALNTLVPASLGSYRDARPELAVADNDLVALSGTDAWALHPALAPLASRWDAGEFAALASIGFEDASRSHFVARDWWSAGTAGPADTGWLGRWLDATAGGDPQADALRAIAIGSGAPTLRAQAAPSTSMRTIESYSLQLPRGGDPGPQAEAWDASAASGSDGLRGLVDEAIRTTLGSVERLDAALGDDDGENLNVGVLDERAVTDGLAAAASIIEADLGTQVLVVGADGYDTHSGQAARHEALLEDLARGIDGFFDRLGARSADVVVVTTSEFGRRVEENGSGGTDHGRAGTQLLVGPGIAGGRVVGEVDLDRLEDGDLRPVIDTRSLYAVALDWLGGPTDEILDGTFDRFDLLA